MNGILASDNITFRVSFEIALSIIKSSVIFFKCASLYSSSLASFSSILDWMRLPDAVLASHCLVAYLLTGQTLASQLGNIQLSKIAGPLLHKLHSIISKRHGSIAAVRHIHQQLDPAETACRLWGSNMIESAVSREITSNDSWQLVTDFNNWRRSNGWSMI